MSSARPLPRSFKRRGTIDADIEPPSPALSSSSSSTEDDGPVIEQRQSDVGKRARDRAARIATYQKKNAFKTIWESIVNEFGNDRLVALFGPSPSNTVWRICVAHKFRNFVSGDEQSIRGMEMRIRTEILSRDARSTTITVPVPAPAPAPVANQIPIPQPLFPGPAPQLAPRPPHIRVDLVRPPVTYIRPPPPPPQVQVQQSHVSPLALSDTMTVEEIERAFAARGLGESGKQCPVCLECKSKWIKFSRNCKHDLCEACAVSWMKINTIATGARCPGCVAEHVGSPQIADPRVMFGKNWDTDYVRMVFTTFQIPLLQAEIEQFELGLNRTPASSSSSSSSVPMVKPTPAKCPACMTISERSSVIRRCYNPRCAIEFCSKCETTISEDCDCTRHIRGGCAATVAETKQILSGKGLAACLKCMTPLWHAQHHGCHHVKCPNCGQEQCHSCGRTYKHPDCKCPIFCRPDFACKCSDSCPECTIAKCKHCDGYCPTCVSKRSI